MAAKMTAKELQTLRVIAAGKSKRKKPRTAAQKRATAKMIRANKAAKRKKTRAGSKGKTATAPKRKKPAKARTAGSKARPRKGKKAKPQRAKPAPGASKLSGPEREGMALIADLVASQFPASGKLKDARPFVKQLSDAQRRALIAADRRVRKAAGR